jgi:radical SAM superfamily enzyme YgiQ (UPF0313 family)
MKKAGCYRVAFGFESGNDQVLKSFGKGGRASLENGKIAVKLARKAGLEVHGYFLIGLSDDNKDTIEETISYARTLPLDLLKFGVALAFPGTRMFNRYRERGLIKSFNWDNYHMYSGSELFSHEALTKDEINQCIKKAYRKTTFLSPRFIMRRLIYSIKNMNLLLQARSFFKYIFLSYTKSESNVFYKYQSMWPEDVSDEDTEKIFAI